MHRNLQALAETRFDVLVIGGGIVGVCMARDAARRGLHVALIERDDWGAGTSSNSLKIVHGGLRYFQHLDIRRMRESIQERATWLRIAPHLVHPLPILLPTYRRGLERRGFVATALRCHDALARRLPGGDALPPARVLSPGECLDLVPALADPQLTGGILFHDAQMYSSERLVLEHVLDAANAGAVVANYAAALGPAAREDAPQAVLVQDRLGNGTFPVRARMVVCAAGPATVSLGRRLLRGGSPAPAQVPHAAALNLVLQRSGPAVAYSVRGHHSTRRFFVVPWRGRTLVGTAHVPYAPDPEHFSLPERFVVGFLDELNAALPGPSVVREDVRLVHAGLVPSVLSPSGDVAGLLKRPRILEHGHVLMVVTVKYTTARLVAEWAVDRVCRRLGAGNRRSDTADAPLPSAPAGSLDELLRTAQTTLSDRVPADVVDHLVHAYGRRYEEVVTGAAPQRLMRVAGAHSPVILAQFDFGVREEMVGRAEDLVFRRTEIGAVGDASEAVLHEARVAMGRASVVTSHTLG